MTKILCVEDEAFLREDIAEELEDSGYEVIQAGDGKEGLEQILEHRPDLVLSDITMPNMDGYELLRAVRTEHAEFAEMPFIFLSALSDRDHVLDGMRIGADDYLIKPIDFELMLVKVEASLRQSQRFIRKKEEEAVKLYTALTRNETPSAEAVAGKEDKNQPFSPTNLPPLNFMCVGELDAESRHFADMLKKSHHKVTLFTSENAYFEVLAELPIHIAFLWRSDHEQRQKFSERAEAIKPKNIIVRLIPRENRKKKQAQKADANDLVVALPVTMKELSAMVAGWISRKINA